MSEHDEIQPDHDLLAFAAGEVRRLLERSPDLTGQEVQKLLAEEAARVPAVPPATTFHLVVDAAQPSAFCGELAGPDRGTWHRGQGLDGFVDEFASGSTCCPLCVLAAGKMMERSRDGL